MSVPLERRYERMLVLYPHAWRKQHGQIVVGTLLEMAGAEGRTAPTLAERLDLVIHGMLTRLGVFLPAGVRDGIAAVAMATGSAFALLYVWFSGWAPLMRNREMQRELYAFGPFINPGVVLCAIWFVAFALAIFGCNRAAKAALVGSILVAVLIPWTNRLVPEWDGPSSMNLGFLAILAALALIGTPRSRSADFLPCGGRRGGS